MDHTDNRDKHIDYRDYAYCNNSVVITDVSPQGHIQYTTEYMSNPNSRGILDPRCNDTSEPKLYIP